MNEMRGYAAAQREWENMEPPDGGPCECPECSGKGYTSAGDPETGETELDNVCEACAGHGLLTARGEPFDPLAKERAECDYADWKREQRRDEDGAS